MAGNDDAHGYNTVSIFADPPPGVCGHYRRKLIPGTLEVYPIEGFGAIEEGQQDFCDLRSDTCFGQAKFMIVWHRTPEGWRTTRIFSYGHHAIDAGGNRPGSTIRATSGH